MNAAPPEHGPLDVPFDQYQRYRITADLANAMVTGPAAAGAISTAAAAASGSAQRAPRALRVLDVGGHHSDFWGRPRRPIADFLPDAYSVTLDVGPNPLRGYVRGRGDALPFHAGSFDLVCSVDVLEHVPPAARMHLADELRRVSARAIILAAPFRHPLLERAEGFVSDFIEKTCGYMQGQLREHKELGWPDLMATWRDLSREGWSTRVFPYGNLWRWVLMMIDKHAVSAVAGSRGLQSRLDRHYNETWFALDRSLPAYRYFIVAARAADDPILTAAEQRFEAVRDPDRVLPRGADDEAERAFSLLAIHAENQTLQARLEPERRDTQVAELETLKTELYKNLDAMYRENARLVAMLRDIERSAPYRAIAALRRWLPGR